MKYKVYIETSFSSAHWLKMYKGKCERLHGHNWKVGVVVSSSSLNQHEMVIDFTKLKKIVNKIINRIDHRCLNHISYFRKKQPTAENIAYYIHHSLLQKLKNKNILSIEVIVWETPSQYASYEG